MANMELKLRVSLHCLATLTSCLTTRIRRLALGSPTTSPMAHIISRLTSSAKSERLGLPYREFSLSNRSSTYSVASICRKAVKSSTMSCVLTSTGLSCRRERAVVSLPRSDAMSSGSNGSEECTFLM